MRSYPLHIGGEDLVTDAWTYVPDASALIAEPRRAFDAKRALELGRPVTEEQRALMAGRCGVCDDDQVDRAVAAAAAAARVFGRFDPRRRRQLGLALHERMVACAQEFVDVLVAEGHPRRLASWEVEGIVDASSPEALEWGFAQSSQTFDDGERRMLLTRKPDGVVCVNPPQNAAASNAALGLMAMLAGNALVVKAPKTAPLGVMFLYREVALPVLARFGAPPGTINLVSNYSKRVLNRWLASPLVDDVMFFGESSAGLRFGNECTQRGIKPILELSGNDAFVVWRDADLERAAHTLTESFYGSSQICMVPKQAILHPAIAGEFTELFLECVRPIRPSPLDDPRAVLSPVLKMDRFFDVLGEAVAAGADQLCGGARVGLDGLPAGDGLFLEPTVVRIDGLRGARELRCVREETFFPLLPLVVASDCGDDDALLDVLIDWLNDNPYGLRNSVWAADPGVVDAFALGVRNGGLLKINDSHVGFSRFLGTHGGTGMTGGPHGELHYPMLRTSHLQGISFGPARRERRDREPLSAIEAT